MKNINLTLEMIILRTQWTDVNRTLKIVYVSMAYSSAIFCKTSFICAGVKGLTM